MHVVRLWLSFAKCLPKVAQFTLTNSVRRCVVMNTSISIKKRNYQSPKTKSFLMVCFCCMIYWNEAERLTNHFDCYFCSKLFFLFILLEYSFFFLIFLSPFHKLNKNIAFLACGLSLCVDVCGSPGFKILKNLISCF